MFCIGDKIVYPRHGAGVIEGIEEKEVLGEKCKYYVIRIPLGDMYVMVPMENMEKSGVREITPRSGLTEVYDILSGKTSYMCKNWSKRYRENEMKMKKGDIYEISELVKNLTVADREKKLSTGEKRMLDNARQLLVSELMLILEETHENVEEAVQNMIKD